MILRAAALARAWRAAGPRVRPLCTYERIEPVEHVLKRPTMYVGSTDLTTDVQWLVDGGGGLVLRRCQYVPAVLKVFDEILVNALDARQRSRDTNRIDVEIDGASGRFSVRNNGPGIDVAEHPTEGVMIPELVLGNLYAGSNFDDTALRTVGGRHGFGAKLTNIFSSEFAVETVDLSRSLHYTQRWADNMATCGKPVVRAAKKRGEERLGLTRIAFVLDLPKLGMPKGALEGSDTLGLMRRRVLDAAALAGPDAAVRLNGEPLPARTFAEYVRACARALRAPSAGAEADAADAVSDAAAKGEARQNLAEVCTLTGGAHPWQLGVGFAPDGNGPEASLSFVNGVHTSKGGTHVSVVSDALCKALAPVLAKSLPPSLLRLAGTLLGKDELPKIVTPALVSSHLFIALSAVVDNPSFDSQSKERLTTRAAALGHPADSLSAQFVAKVAAIDGLRDAIAAAVAAKHAALLTRVRKAKPLKGGRPNVAKLEDAMLAGSSRSSECTLIVTEGDSAKALAVAGLEVVGREHYGVLPLRGKTLNVRQTKLARVSSNAEIGALLASLGVSPTDGREALRQKLRYGRLLLMTDQDHDGSHIKGLVINLVHCFWPQLLEKGEFVCQFVTPIVKARLRGAGAGSARGKGKGARGDLEGGDGSSAPAPLSFYSLGEYDQWRRSLEPSPPTPASSSPSSSSLSSALPAPPPAELSRYTIKYYKGLGTSTSQEARAYFSQFDAHVKRMLWGGEADGDSIDMAFNSKRVADRRRWILEATARAAAADQGDALEAVDATPLPALLAPAAHAPRLLATASSAPPAAADAKGPGARLPPVPPRPGAQASASLQPSAGASAIVERTIGEFISRDLVQYSLADCVRSIPSVLDGLKPSQRKVLYSCFKRRMGAETEVKVSQLASSVAETTEYHHGEASLINTIIGMAQDFVGANSLPLLHGVGQFGTRARGGADHAAARYIYVRLSPLARKLFPAEDDVLLPRVEVEGKLVEPTAFVPVLPMVLLNGAKGIGTGWSSACPSFNPMHVLANARVLAALGADAPDAEARRALQPIELWDAGFSGLYGPLRKRARGGGAKALTMGAAEVRGASTIVVSELPVGVWTEQYKEYLLQLQAEAAIGGFSEAHSERRVHFELKVSAAQRAALHAVSSAKVLAELRNGSAGAAPELSDDQLALLHNLKLTASVSTGNMHLFSARGEITLFDDAHAILLEHARARRSLYSARRAHELRKLRAAELALANRARFVQLVNDGRIAVLGAPRASLEGTLGELGFATRSALAFAGGVGADEPGAAVDADSDAIDGESGEGAGGRAERAGGGAGDGEYGYLLRTPLHELTSERVARLNAQHAECARSIQALEASSDRHMWERELDALHEPLERLVADARPGALAPAKPAVKAKAKPAVKRSSAVKSDASGLKLKVQSA